MATKVPSWTYNDISYCSLKTYVFSVKELHYGVYPESVFQLQGASEDLEDLLKQRLLDPISRVSDSVVLGWGLRICISNIFLCDADSPGNSLWEPLHLVLKWGKMGLVRIALLSLANYFCSLFNTVALRNYLIFPGEDQPNRITHVH